MDTKTCHDCKINKPLSDFNKNNSRKDGLQTRCRECDRAHAKVGYHTKYKTKHITRASKRKADLRNWIDEYRKSLKCEQCGEARWYVLDFHHHEKNKEDSVCNLICRGCSKQRILKEIQKCKVLCSNCHRELHHLEGKLIW